MKKLIIIIFAILLFSCEGGLEPPAQSGKSYLSGTLIFADGKNNWPPVDSLFGIRIAAFKKFPSENILTEIVAGNAYFDVNSLPLYVDSAKFSLEITNPPVNLVYIIAVQQYDSSITSQRVVGVYSLDENNTTHDSLMIEPGRTYNITIPVDFDNLPPMPF